MNNLYIKGTSQTPHIDFRPEDRIFIISGRSVPEDCDIYYYPVLRYLEVLEKQVAEYNQNKTLYFEFRLIYYNTASIRYLNSVMNIIQKIQKKNKVLLKWFYDSDDEYLEEMGEYFRDSYEINFELIRQEIQPKNNKN